MRLHLKTRVSPNYYPTLIFLSSLIIAAASFFVYDRYLGFLPEEKTMFGVDAASQLQKLATNGEIQKKMVLNHDGTINYLNEDFSGYGSYSKLVESFDNTHQIQTSDNSSLSVVSDSYEGNGSVRVTPKVSTHVLTITKQFDAPIDLSQWNNQGFATMWMNVSQRTDIKGVGLKFQDQSGNTRELTEVINPIVNSPHTIKDSPQYPDISLPDPGHAPVWVNYWLNNGWNYIFWSNLKKDYKDHGAIDLSKISSFAITLNLVGSQHSSYLLDDLRMVKGIQRQNNPTAGNWFPPLDGPQYGIFDIIPDGSGGNALKLLNVRRTQYPSNGDHARILSAGGSPTNFTERVRFSVNNLTGNFDNTYLRFSYDFDPFYDPGHDWYGVYISLQYKKAGLITVIPIKRFTIQSQEPQNSNKRGADHAKLVLKEDSIYELQMTVRGQENSTTIYSVRSDGELKKLTNFHYDFVRPRKQTRNPIGIEVTGNAKATIYDVEVVQL